MVRHVRTLARMWIVFSTLVVLGAAAGTVYFLGPGDDAKTAGELMFLSVGSIPGIVGGVGLLRARPWARVLLLVLGALNLMFVPIGTALGGYTFWVLLIRSDASSPFEHPEPR